LGIRIRIEGQKNQEISVEKCTFKLFKKMLPLKRYKIALTTFFLIWWITRVFFIWFDSNFDFKKFDQDIVFESSVLAWIRIRNWIRIRIEQKSWIRIRIESIRIHKPGLNPGRQHSCGFNSKRVDCSSFPVQAGTNTFLKLDD
jgi:hypothetical protein